MFFSSYVQGKELYMSSANTRCFFFFFFFFFFF